MRAYYGVGALHEPCNSGTGILPAEAPDKCSADGTSAAPSRLVEA